jgi:protein TonB
MRNILLFILLFSLNSLFSQNTPELSYVDNGKLYHIDNGNKIFLATEVDVKAEYKNGINGLAKEVGKKFNVPEFNDKKIHKIYLSFIVDIDGSISDIIGITGGEQKLIDEGIRVFKLLPNNWIPAKKDGQFVRMQYNFPISLSSD